MQTRLWDLDEKGLIVATTYAPAEPEPGTPQARRWIPQHIYFRAYLFLLWEGEPLRNNNSRRIRGSKDDPVTQSLAKWFKIWMANSTLRTMVNAHLGSLTKADIKAWKKQIHANFDKKEIVRLRGEGLLWRAIRGNVAPMWAAVFYDELDKL